MADEIEIVVDAVAADEAATEPDVEAETETETPWWEKFSKRDDDDDEPEKSETDPAKEPAKEPAKGKEEPAKGTESAPLDAADVPDQWVRAKVDGQEVALHLRDCVQRGIATATLQKRLAEVAEVRKSADAEIEKSGEERQIVQAFIQRVTSDPEFCRAWFRRQAPEVFRRAAEAEIHDFVNTKPEEREARQLAEERARLEHDRAEWQRQQAEGLQQQSVARAQSELRPMLERAATTAGLDLGPEYLALMRPRLDPIFGAGRMPTEDEVLGAARQIAAWRVVSPAPVPDAPKPAPPRTPRRDGRSAPAKPAPEKSQGFDDYFRSVESRYYSNKRS